MGLVTGPQPSGDAACDAFDSVVAEVLEMRPVTWLYSMPFVENLERLIREGHDGPIQ